MASRPLTHSTTPRMLFKQYALLVVKIMLAVVVLYLLIHTAQIKIELIGGFVHKPLLLFGTVMMFIAMVVLNAERWHLLNAAQNINLGFLRTILPTYLGVAFNNLLPGAIGGDFVRSYYLFKKAPNKKSTALISIFLDRLFGFLGLVVAICFVAITRLSLLNEQPHLFYMFFIFAAICVGALASFGILMMLPQRMGVTHWLLNRFPSKRWAKSLVSLIQAVRNYRLPKMVMLKCLAISVIIQLLGTVTLVMIANMMDLPHIAFTDYLIAIGITQVVNLIPVTPGGIGIGEMAFANILLLLNPGKSAAFATIFLGYRLISMLTYLPGVVCYVPQFMSLKHKTHLTDNVVVGA